MSAREVLHITDVALRDGLQNQPMQVSTHDGNRVVPPQRAVWIPPGMAHEVLMLGVSTRSVYVEPGNVELGPDCQVLNVSPLLRHLLEAALTIEPAARLSVRQRCVLTLLVDEIGAMPELPLSAPLPAEPRLARACQRFLDAPTQTIALDTMAEWSSMSRRTFPRQFLEHTGMTFVAWRQQVCLLEATARLSHGASITDVALGLGFSSSSAFTSVFRRNLGDSPARYLAKSKAASIF